MPTAPTAAPVRQASSSTTLTVELPAVTTAAARGGLTLEAYELHMDDGKGGDFNYTKDTC